MSWGKLSEMKKNLFIVSAIFLISAGYFSCSNENTEIYNPRFSDNIIGRWKLMEVKVWVNSSRLDSTDYLKENIIFDFQENNKLVVTGPIPDVIAVFDDFQEGEHYYVFRSPNERNYGYAAIPPPRFPNLSIDDTALGSEERGYFCEIPLNEKTMEIAKRKTIGGETNQNGWILGGDYYYWKKIFIKLNEL